jgi:hypothetical protein
MARPNVTVTVVDNSFVIPGTEGGSPHTSGMYSANGLVGIFGVTAEVADYMMTIPSLTDWMSRLNGTTFGGSTGSGPTGAWQTEWYSAYNYLLYGGTLNIASNTTRLLDPNVTLDSVFTPTISSTQVSFVDAIISARSDVMGVIGVTFTGYTGSTVPSSPTLFPTISNASTQIIAVGGEKVTLSLTNNTLTQTFVNVPLAADAAGCLARTDRDARPWFAPAGTTRGRILNAVRLVKNPTSTEQDNLYDAKINPVIAIAGQGIFLFGQKTFTSDTTSTLTRINVVRLINYVKRILSQAANGVLFELNDETTRSLFKNSADGFLQTVQDARGVYAYKVVCDETNNTPNIIDSNQFVADIYLKPEKAAEYIKLTITNLNTGTAL